MPNKLDGKDGILIVIGKMNSRVNGTDLTEAIGSTKNLDSNIKIQKKKFNR